MTILNDSRKKIILKELYISHNKNNTENANLSEGEELNLNFIYYEINIHCPSRLMGYNDHLLCRPNKAIDNLLINECCKKLKEHQRTAMAAPYNYKKTYGTVQHNRQIEDNALA